MRDDPDEMDKMAMEYFGKLFQATTPNCSLDIIFEGASFNSLYADQEYGLSAPFVAKDVKEVLFMMHQSKAPGPNSFHAAFYRKYWSIMGEEVTSLVLNFLNKGGYCWNS